MDNIAQSIIKHLGVLANSTYGQVLVLINIAFSFSIDEKLALGIVFVAIFADLLWGMIAAKKLGKFILSHAIRETFKKIGIYAFALIGIALIEKTLHGSGLIGLKIACAIAASCELWSISASMLIIKPNMPFLKIFRLQLKGEIERKIGKNLDNILKDKDDEAKVN